MGCTRRPSLDDALQRLREANSDETRRQALDALEQAVQRLRQEVDLKKKAAPAQK
jgi:hypothetical protein